MLTSAHETDVTLIHELWIDYSSAIMSGDIDRWISLWISGGIEMQPAGSRLSGIEQIRAASQPVMELFVTEMTISPGDVRIFGDCAYSFGSYSCSMIPKEGGESINSTGMFLAIFEKQASGTWKIAITCFNISPQPKSFSLYKQLHNRH
jgi:uncharacterized protein (TIGR02246 family)